MVKLLDLPAELRQQILLLALPQSITVASPPVSPLADFLLICKQIKQDLEEIASQYEPVYIVTNSLHLRFLKRRLALGRFTTIVLHIFSSTKVCSLLDQRFLIAVPHPVEILLEDWIDKLAAPRNTLPISGLKSVSLDITPVPGYARGRSRAWIAWLINNRQVSNRLWNFHELWLARLVDVIGTWLQITSRRQQPVLRIAGTISPKSQPRMPSVLEVLDRLKNEGVHTALDVEYLDDSDLLTWEAALELFQIENEAAKDPRLRRVQVEVKRHIRHTMERNKRLRSLFTKNSIADAEWTQNILLDVARLAASQRTESDNSFVGEQSLTYEYMDPLKRALLHQLAEALGLRSESSGEMVDTGITYKIVTIEKVYGDSGGDDGAKMDGGSKEDGPDVDEQYPLVYGIA